MASILSLVLATLVVGTIFNLGDELRAGSKPFRPIHSLLKDPLPWLAVYGAAAATGALSLLANAWHDSWWFPPYFTAAVTFVFLAFANFQKGMSFKKYRRKLRRELPYILAFTLIALLSAAATLAFLSLIDI